MLMFSVIIQLMAASIVVCRPWMRFSELCFHRSTEVAEASETGCHLLLNAMNRAPSRSSEPNTLRRSVVASPACHYSMLTD